MPHFHSFHVLSMECSETPISQSFWPPDGRNWASTVQNRIISGGGHHILACHISGHSFCVFPSEYQETLISLRFFGHQKAKIRLRLAKIESFSAGLISGYSFHAVFLECSQTNKQTVSNYMSPSLFVGGDNNKIYTYLRSICINSTTHF